MLAWSELDPIAFVKAALEAHPSFVTGAALFVTPKGPRAYH